MILNHRFLSLSDSSSSQGMSEPQREEPRPPVVKSSSSSSGPAPKPIPIPVSEPRETCQSPLGGQTNMQVSSGLAAAFRPIQPSSAPPPPPPPLHEGINLVMDGAAKKPYHAPQSQSTNYNPNPTGSGRCEWKPLIPTPPPPADCGYNSYGGDAFHPAPSVQRVTGGSHLHFKKDGTPGNPYLKGAYRYDR